MSAAPLLDRKFILDGAEPMNGTYDEVSDVLYLWRGDNSSDAVVVHESDDGVLVRADAATGELVGVTILDWTGRPRPDRFEIPLPSSPRRLESVPV